MVMETQCIPLESGALLRPVADDAGAAALEGLAGEIWRECYGEILAPEQIGYMVEKFLSRQAVLRQSRQNGALFYLVEFPDGPGGFMALQPEGGRLLLSKLYLQASRRGGGHARAAMAYAEDTARRLECRSIRLTVNKHNARAMAVYEKAGYTRTGSQVADIGNDYVMDDYLYEKPL